MTSNYKRPSWDEYFFDMVDTVSKRGTCDRGRSGCVVVKDRRILTTGYVGAPAGMPHCDDVGHKIKSVTHEDGTTTQHCFRTIHAEQNAVIQAAKHGISLAGSTLYCRMTPCSVCAGFIVGCGIVEVKCQKRHQTAGDGEEILANGGVKLTYLSEEIMQYN